MQFSNKNDKPMTPLLVLLLVTVFSSTVSAQFGNIFQQMFNQKQEAVEKNYFNSKFCLSCNTVYLPF